MLENVKRLKALKRQAREINPETDENGKELLCVQVRTDEDFLSPYSSTKGAVISESAAEFFDNAVKALPLKNELHICIESDEIDKNEQTVYKEAVKNYYRSRVVDIDRRLKVNARAALWMTVIAALILTLYVILELKGTNYILSEMVDIAAWVFMWEAVDLFFLERKILKVEQLRACRLFGAEISYRSLSSG